MSEVIKRYDCGSGKAQHCYGCYQMEETELGDYVLASDYDKQSARIEKLEELLLAAKEHLVEYINADYPPYKLTYSFNKVRFELDMAIIYEIDAVMAGSAKGGE